MQTKELVNTKLAAKANRQLQDPLVIMTGHLPKWLPELVRTCPFLFPFETRLMYFYASSFDRDRAMQKLLDTNTDLNQTNMTDMAGNTNERIVPKLERKKKTIVRADDIIKQTETILNDFASPKSKALLEIQYENEVGTGLGPTLEFYALTSLEIQKVDYDLWRGDKIKISTAKGYNQNSLFFYSPSGLYPAPLAKSTKTQLVTKIRNKFKVFGKFVAKAIMDFRVLDIHLSIAFYKWLIDHKTLNESDIKYIDAGLYRSLNALGDYLAKYKAHTNTHAKLNAILKADQHASKAAVDAIATNAIKMQFKQVECDIAKLNGIVNDLVLDFTLPGYSHIELKKGGKDVSVSLANLEEYIKVRWTQLGCLDPPYLASRLFRLFHCVLLLLSACSSLDTDRRRSTSIRVVHRRLQFNILHQVLEHILPGRGIYFFACITP
jgi:E3 ubiquitin-protein ligase TRIP12